jgi:hypothetical protein
MSTKTETELIDSAGGARSEPGGRARRPAGGAPSSAGRAPPSACSTWSTTRYRWFCEVRLGRTIRTAATLEARNHRAAGILWARIDREFVASASRPPTSSCDR